MKIESFILAELKIEHEFEIVPRAAHNATAVYQKLGAREFVGYQNAN